MRFPILLLLALSATAQVPDKFTNLQVLPKDIAKPALMNMMRGFSFSLGARCVDCHAGKDTPNLSEINFASDDKETKKTARTMLRMVATINNDYVGKLANASTARVGCETCHHGLRKPQTLQSALTAELEKKDLAAAVALYGELRKKYYGGAQYDFTETSLNQLTESLLAQRKTKEAAAFMEINAANTTMTRWGINLLAMAHKANGDKDKAIADFQKIVEANPNDAWAKGQLQELQSGKTP